MPEGDIGPVRADSPEVQELLRRHLAFAHTHSPPEDVHALDNAGLRDPRIALYGFRAGGELLGVGALMLLDSDHGELKFMHTAAEARRRGVGRAMLVHLLGEARARGLHRVSLETGTMEAFAPARAMYEAAGFAYCEPFAEYRVSPNSCCMTLSLE